MSNNNIDKYASLNIKFGSTKKPDEYFSEKTSERQQKNDNQSHTQQPKTNAQTQNSSSQQKSQNVQQGQEKEIEDDDGFSFKKDIQTSDDQSQSGDIEKTPRDQKNDEDKNEFNKKINEILSNFEILKVDENQIKKVDYNKFSEFMIKRFEGNEVINSSRKKLEEKIKEYKKINIKELDKLDGIDDSYFMTLRYQIQGDNINLNVDISENITYENLFLDKFKNYKEFSSSKNFNLLKARKSFEYETTKNNGEEYKVPLTVEMLKEIKKKYEQGLKQLEHLSSIVSKEYFIENYLTKQKTVQIKNKIYEQDNFKEIYQKFSEFEKDIDAFQIKNETPDDENNKKKSNKSDVDSTNVMNINSQVNVPYESRIRSYFLKPFELSKKILDVSFSNLFNEFAFIICERDYINYLNEEFQKITEIKNIDITDYYDSKVKNNIPAILKASVEHRSEQQYSNFRTNLIKKQKELGKSLTKAEVDNLSKKDKEDIEKNKKIKENQINKIFKNVRQEEDRYNFEHNTGIENKNINSDNQKNQASENNESNPEASGKQQEIYQGTYDQSSEEKNNTQDNEYLESKKNILDKIKNSNLYNQNIGIENIKNQFDFDNENKKIISDLDNDNIQILRNARDDFKNYKKYDDNNSADVYGLVNSEYNASFFKILSKLYYSNQFTDNPNINIFFKKEDENIEFSKFSFFKKNINIEVAKSMSVDLSNIKDILTFFRSNDNSSLIYGNSRESRDVRIEFSKIRENLYKIFAAFLEKILDIYKEESAKEPADMPNVLKFNSQKTDSLQDQNLKTDHFNRKKHLLLKELLEEDDIDFLNEMLKMNLLPKEPSFFDRTKEKFKSMFSRNKKEEQSDNSKQLQLSRFDTNLILNIKYDNTFFEYVKQEQDTNNIDQQIYEKNSSTGSLFDTINTLRQELKDKKEEIKNVLIENLINADFKRDKSNLDSKKEKIKKILRINELGNAINGNNTFNDREKNLFNQIKNFKDEKFEDIDIEKLLNIEKFIIGLIAKLIEEKKLPDEVYLDLPSDTVLTFKSDSSVYFNIQKIFDKEINDENKIVSKNTDIKKIEEDLQKLSIIFQNLLEYKNNSLSKFNLNESKYYLKMKSGKLLLEKLEKGNEEDDHESLNFGKEYFNKKRKEIEKLVKLYYKEEDEVNKEEIKKNIVSLKKNTINEIYFQIMKNQISYFNSLKNPNNLQSQKMIKVMEKRLGFSPTPNNFAKQSVLKFEKMCEISRIVSNVIFLVSLSNMSQLNLVYLVAQDENLTIQGLSNMYVKYENDFKNVIVSFQDKEVIKKFDELVEDVEGTFGAGSVVYNSIKDMYQKIVDSFQKQQQEINKFKQSLKEYADSYFSIKEEKEKNQLRIELIKSFLTLRGSKELNSLHKIFLKNEKFFNEFLANVKAKNQKMGFEKLLEVENHENFEDIYQKQKTIFDKTYDKCLEVLGKDLNQGKLDELFRNLEQTKNELENKKYDKQEKETETQNTQVKQKTDLNKNTKPEQENKQDKTEETSENKTESKKIKQGLKLLNNSTVLKINQKKV